MLFSPYVAACYFKVFTAIKYLSLSQYFFCKSKQFVTFFSLEAFEKHFWIKSDFWTHSKIEMTYRAWTNWNTVASLVVEFHTHIQTEAFENAGHLLHL